MLDDLTDDVDDTVVLDVLVAILDNSVVLMNSGDVSEVE